MSPWIKPGNLPMFKPRDTALLTWYEQEFLKKVSMLGGFFNAHGHFDRAHTLQPEFLAHKETTPLRMSNASLRTKQDAVGDLHKGIAYEARHMRKRLIYTIERQIALGVSRADTNIDATPDLPDGGLMAIKIALDLKKKYASRGFDLRIAPTPIFGFKPDSTHQRTRWEVFEEAAEMCDYLSLLPEKDDPEEADGRIGFKRHIRRGIELGWKLGKEVQLHLDQTDLPNERGTERLLEILDGLDQPSLGGKPAVWVVHMISPSGYSEDRFRRLVDELDRLNVGVIVCPTAALSMRQIRSVEAYKHNSIARIAELAKRGIPIRLGTDNIEDMFVPQGNGDMLTECIVGGVALRMNASGIWAKLAAGVPLDNVDISEIGGQLYQDRLACMRADPAWKAGVE